MSVEEKRARAAAAAEARRAGNEHREGHTGISADRQGDLHHDAQRQQLIGKIEAYCQANRRDPPFGIRAASLEALRRQWDSMRGGGAHS